MDLAQPQGGRAGEEHVRARHAVLAVPPADRGHRAVPAQQVRGQPAAAGGQPDRLQAGWAFGETTESFAVSYEVAPAPTPPGVYRNITGNVALAYGLVAAAHRSGLRLVLGSYPITPASDILHTLSRLKRFGVTTIQAEDEIAGIGAALGAAYGGAIGVTTTSGPGLALKSETIGLAVSLELPLVVVDVQRGGPSTGLPTKTEQADLLQAMFGRNGEAPVPVLAPRSPATASTSRWRPSGSRSTYRTPVVLLSDGYLANGSEPWRIPDVGDLPDLRVEFTTDAERHPRRRRPGLPPLRPGPRHAAPGLGGARHAGPGAPDRRDREGRRHRGDLLRPRQPRPDGPAAPGQGGRDRVPPLEVDDPAGDAEVLVIGWGSSYGPITAGARLARGTGVRVATAHLRTSTRYRPTPARCCTATAGCSCRR